MAEKIFLEVAIDGHVLRSVRSVNITQGIFDHHSFEVVVPSESIEKDRDSLFEKIPDWIGKTISIDWETGSFKEKGQGTDSSSFKGIVMDVSVSGQRKDHMLISITGKSPTVLMDGLPNSEVYLGVGLKELYDRANASNLTSELKAEDHLTHTDPLPFSVQFNETDFAFLCRMMHEHGEWLYYDGQKIRLGTANGTTLDLRPERAFSLDFSFGVSRPIASLAAWDYLQDKAVHLKSADPKHDDRVAASVQKKSGELYPAGSDKDVNQPFPAFADGEDMQPKSGSLQTDLDKQRQGRGNETFRVVGSSDLAEIQLGCVLKLDGFAYGGEYIVTHVTHSCSGRDNYQNYFQAVPVKSGIPASVSVSRPRIESSIARVTDNKDPKKLGRVRVKFEWGTDETPWLRVVWPHAGKERGFYFVPEIGDEVMVAFEMGRERSPYVVGSLYNGKNAQEKQYNADDKLKVIRTKGGNEIIFNDDGVLTIRNGDNTIELNCKDDGLLTIETKGDMVLKAAKNITIEAGEEFKVGAGKNIGVKSGTDIKLEAGTKFELAASTDATMKATKNFEVAAGMDLTLKGTKGATVSGTNTKVEGMAGAELTSAAITQVKGTMVKIN